METRPVVRPIDNIMSCDPIAGFAQADHRLDKRKYDKNIIK